MTRKGCTHDWIVADDGSNDKICIHCGIKQKQAVMTMLKKQQIPKVPILMSATLPTAAPMMQPIMREKMTIRVSGIGNVSVFKDEFLKDLRKSLMPSMFDHGAYHES